MNARWAIDPIIPKEVHIGTTKVCMVFKCEYDAQQAYDSWKKTNPGLRLRCWGGYYNAVEMDKAIATDGTNYPPRTVYGE